MKKQEFLNLKKNRNLRIFVLLFALILSSYSAFAQTRTVTGTVTDVSGDPLIGVSISVKGQPTIGISTNVEGKFSLGVPAGNITLIVSYIGHITQELAASDQAMNITMREDVQSLEETVVIGYGSVKKSDVTGSLVSVNMEEVIRKNPVTITEGLQGAAAGVQVTRSGGPGGGASIRIRGIGSISNSFAPLYVVDGIRVGRNADYLNPNDIANTEILKDASSTAIFGSEGANGVILITTKKGEAGRARVNFTANYSVLTPADRLDVLDTEGFVKAARLAANASGSTLNALWANHDKGLTYIDWQDEMSRTALTQNYNLNIMGGSDATRAVFSVGYTKNQAIRIGQEYQRLTARLNVDNTIKKIIRVGGSITYNYNENTGSSFGQGGGGSMLTYAILPPTMDEMDASGNPVLVPIQYPDGTWGHFPYSLANVFDVNQYLDNPVAVAGDTKNAKNVGRFNMANANAYTEIDLYKGLTFRTNFGFNAFSGGSATYNALNQRTYYRRNDDFDELSANANFGIGYSVESYLTYNKNINNIHSINVMGGYSASRSGIQVNSNISARYFAAPSIRQITQTQDPSTYNTSPSGLSDETHMLSYFGRLNYGFKSKYLLTATIRKDGSSNFGKGNKWGYFPSAALVWRLSEESFLKEQEYLSNLKLRLTWGQTGNSGFGGDNAVDQLSSARINYYWHNGGAFNLTPGLAQTREIDTNLKWETNEQTNIGVDFGVLKNMLSFTLDYFIRDSKDLLTRRTIRPSAGYENIYTNLGHIRNSGFEISGTFTKPIGSEIFLNLRGNTTFIKNEAIDIGAPTTFNTGATGSWWESSAILQNGYALGTYYGYRADGIFRNQAEIDALNKQAAEKGVNGGYYQARNTAPGDVKFKDLNGDGYVNMNDNTDREELGNGFPKMTFGLNLGITYKKWDASVNMYGSFGQKLLSYAYKELTTMRNADNGYHNILKEYANNSWTPENPNAKYHRLTRTDDNHNTRVSDLYLYNGDYLKIRSIQIGYAFPSNFVKKLQLDNLRLSAAVEDLYTFTKYPGGLDPEFTQAGTNGVQTNGIDQGRYPLPRTFTFALTVGF
ncbi:SusC/RagA family TonB-linked outer membrane protein [Bacteroidia bacterium]|nr:SusC/RagA family TonB-linked outer membrane protein [Bacteroidia bacterium]